MEFLRGGLGGDKDVGTSIEAVDECGSLFVDLIGVWFIVIVIVGHHFQHLHFGVRLVAVPDQVEVCGFVAL